MFYEKRMFTDTHMQPPTEQHFACVLKKQFVFHVCAYVAPPNNRQSLFPIPLNLVALRQAQ